MKFIRAMLRGPCLPFSLCDKVIPIKETWTGHRYLEVYVPPRIFREYSNTVDYRDRCENLWDYYFIGMGFEELSLKALLSYLAEEVRYDDWTFQGDNTTKPIPYLGEFFSSVTCLDHTETTVLSRPRLSIQTKLVNEDGGLI